VESRGPFQLDNGEADPEHVEAEAANSAGEAARRREGNIVTAGDERARQLDERHEMAVGGSTREEDAHAATVLRKP
jgi:hypothetical protein